MAKKEQRFWKVEVEKVITDTVWVKSTDEEHAKTAALKEIHREDHRSYLYDRVDVTNVVPFSDKECLACGQFDGKHKFGCSIGGVQQIKIPVVAVTQVEED